MVPIGGSGQSGWTARPRRLRSSLMDPSPDPRTYMPRLRDVSIRTKLYALLIGYTVVVAVVLTVAGLIQLRYRINGSVYNEIANDKEVINQVSPPNLYIIQPYLTLQELETTTDPSQVQELSRRFRDARSAYQKHLSGSLTTLPRGEMRDALDGRG